MYAKQQAPSSLDGGPADRNKVAEAAITGWEKVYGTMPNINVAESTQLEKATPDNTTSDVGNNNEITYHEEDKVIEQKVFKHLSDQDTMRKLDEALLEAVKEDNSSTVKSLLQQGADVNAADKEGWNYLMYAAWHGHSGVVEILLENGADVNAASKKKTNALMCAGENGHVNIVELMLKQGADVNVVNEEGKTALEMAKENYHSSVVKVLLNHGAEHPKGFIDKLGDGDFGLANTFWIYGILVGLILNLIQSIIPFPSYALAIIFVVQVIYVITVMKGIWLSANKYTGPKIWAVLAKFMVVLNVVMVVFFVIVLMLQ